MRLPPRLRQWLVLRIFDLGEIRLMRMMAETQLNKVRKLFGDKVTRPEIIEAFQGIYNLFREAEVRHPDFTASGDTKAPISKSPEACS